MLLSSCASFVKARTQKAILSLQVQIKLYLHVYCEAIWLLRVQDALVNFVYFIAEYTMCITWYLINNSNPKKIFHEGVISGEEKTQKLYTRIYIYIYIYSTFFSLDMEYLIFIIQNLMFATPKYLTHIRGPSGKFPNISHKNFPVLPWSYSALSHSMYSPLLYMHRCQRFFNVLKHSRKAFLGTQHKCASEFVLIASIDSKQRPFSVDLSFGRTVVVCLAKKSRTRNDECEGTLSCWSIHRFSRHASGLFSWLPHEDVA